MVLKPSSANGSIRRRLIWMEMFTSIKLDLLQKVFDKLKELTTTSSPVAMLKSIRIILAIAAHFDYEIWQMDVKTAFLNGILTEDVYMMQPEGFSIQTMLERYANF